MIARLSSAVFYIITRKLLGAFYVDQKKKDLPPSTLPSEHKQWGRVSGTPNDYFIWDGTKGYEVQVNTNLPIQFKNSALFAVANILTDAENVVDDKAECCNLGQGTMTLKIASSHQSQSLTACYFILGY